MMLIEDLGMREYGSQGYKKRYGLYECPICHEHFESQVGHVKSGATTKCWSCGKKATAKAKALKAYSEFTEKSKAIHGDNCGYSLIDYVNSYTKVELECNMCNNNFWQRPDSHLNGHGCPYCAIYGFNKTKPAIVYYLKITHGDIVVYKIGITNRSIQGRFSNEELAGITILETWKYLIGAEAYEHEQHVLNQYKDYKYTGEPILSSGNTELFIIDILELDNKDCGTTRSISESMVT